MSHLDDIKIPKDFKMIGDSDEEKFTWAKEIIENLDLDKESEQGFLRGYLTALFDYSVLSTSKQHEIDQLGGKLLQNAQQG